MDTTNGIASYARFYALLRQLPGADKEALVSQYTDGRTASLRQMTRREYDALCRDLEQLAGRRDALRRKRSHCLRLMQQMGIDTTDWARVDAFCTDPRIAGRSFGRITPDGLDHLARKLMAIRQAGGLKPSRPVVVPLPQTGEPLN